MFAWIAGVVVVGCSLALAAWSAADVARRLTGGVRTGVLVLLGAALVSGAAGPSPSLPLRAVTVHYEGPDLLSGEAEVTEVVGTVRAVPGVSWERTLRTTQGGVLLSESTRTEVGFPLALCAFVLGWLAVRGRLPGGVGRRAVAGVAWPLLLAGAAGCSGDGPPPPTAAEALLVEALEMRRTGDVEGVLDAFHPVATWEDHPSQTEYRGAEEIAAFLGGIHAWADGVFLDVVRMYALGDVAVAEWVLEGTQARPIPGQLDSVTYRRFRIEGVTLVEVEGRLIVRAVDYADVAPFFLDLGARVTLPGGSVLARPDSALN